MAKNVAEVAVAATIEVPIEEFVAVILEVRSYKSRFSRNCSSKAFKSLSKGSLISRRRGKLDIYR